MHTYIIVADSARARILVKRSATAKIEEIEGFVHREAHLRNQDLVSDAPGRPRNTHGSLDASTSPRDHQADLFARSLTRHLKDLHNQQHFDHLILIAPPRFLGILRHNLPGPLDKLVNNSIDKDLTVASVEDIAKHIES